ncbi:hypothetical protein [Occallatibacter riparius]|uniref:Uncharacterized protein n=1 Tax=Occallatibacter riparius TaxID=1002689 RepID=A0A9J7BHF7_9BACT|nr:hypothetical protein [Occallatibacter riparius]UWZ81851.1 hypothetical protein MOP44_14805 [Occallatibacter riparius]
MNPGEGLIAVLLASIVLGNKDTRKWFSLICCVYAAVAYWYSSLPVALIIGLVWGICWLVNSGQVKAMFFQFGVIAGLILAVIGLYNLFPRLFQAAIGILALGFYAYVIVAVIWLLVADPWKAQRR